MKKHPPHPHHKHSHKSLLIFLISLGILLSFALLLLPLQSSVGRAYTSLPSDVFPKMFIAGAEAPINIPLSAGQTFTLMVGASLGSKNSTAFEFTLSYPQDILDINIDNINSTLSSHWGEDFFRKTIIQAPALNTIKVEHATWNFTRAVTGSVHLAELTFTVKAGKELNGSNIDMLRFLDFHVLNLDSPAQENILSGPFVQPDGQLTCPSCPAPTLESCTSFKSQLCVGVDHVDQCLSSSVNASPSTCGDGRIGFNDTNNNHLQDANEPLEACDISSCADCNLYCHGCKYLEFGYKGINCYANSTICTIQRMTSQELFLGKVNALINSQCYPGSSHPQALYCTPSTQIAYTNGKLDLQNKIKLIAQLSTALTDFLKTAVS